MPTVLYQHDGHSCLMFHDLCDAGGEAVQANQFLIVDDKTGAIIDPGGNVAYNDLYMGVTQHFPPSKLSAILASHADPDIVAALDRWTTSTQAKIYVSTLWERFLPHFCKPGKTEGRIVGIPDAGMRIRIGRHHVIALPAHFMHAEGNFQFYDPVSRILFSGDLGVSLLHGADCGKPVRALADVLPHMEAFHRRYMVCNKILRLWADMVETLKIDMIVPQHGAPLAGPAVQEFIDWVRDLQCGVDLFGPRNYVVPS